MNADAWEAEHRRREWGTWPDSHLVRYAMRTFPPEKRCQTRVLDIGCGAGAQSFFMAKVGFDVTGIDTSPTAIDRCIGRREQGHAIGGYTTFTVASATMLPSHFHDFDLAVDVCSMQCLDDLPYYRAVAEVARALKRGGRFFSIHMSRDCWKSISVVGEVYPRSSADLLEMLRPHFKCDFYHETHERRHPEDPRRRVSIAHWMVEARKR